MSNKKSIAAVYFLFFICLYAAAQLKVACIGNSITYGYGIENRDSSSYPSRLAKLLGSEWEVGNFGVNGATLLNNGDKPYRLQKEFTEAKAFNPAVVIIKLGTNDTKPQNWKHKSEYISDYSALIKEIRALPSKPFVFICLPAPAFGVRWGIRDSIIRADVIPMLKTIAESNKVPLIDLNIPLINHPEWFPDLIHPDARGAEYIAEIVHASLMDRKRVIIKNKQ